MKVSFEIIDEKKEKPNTYIQGISLTITCQNLQAPWLIYIVLERI